MRRAFCLQLADCLQLAHQAPLICGTVWTNWMSTQEALNSATPGCGNNRNNGGSTGLGPTWASATIITRAKEQLSLRCTSTNALV